MRRKVSILAIFVLIGVASWAQDSLQHYNVKAIAKATVDSVVLRWAPTHPFGWEMGNKYGYIIEKVPIKINGKIVKNPIGFAMTGSPIIPKPIADWEDLVNESDFAAIAAQAIYGATFEMTTDYSSDIFQIYQKSKELESRYSFALFSADMSADIAKYSALMYVDKDLIPNEQYVYKIYLKASDPSIAVDTAYVFADHNDYQQVPKPYRFEASFGDKMVQLKWDKSLFYGVFTAYYVERANENLEFERINDFPIVQGSPGKKGSQYAYYLDSIPLNGKKYYYRLVGITPFGETSPPSDTISGIGKPHVKGVPALKAEVSKNEEQVRLDWTFPRSENDKIKGFVVYRSNHDREGYIPLNEELLSNDIRTFEDNQPLSTNYYRVAAIDFYNEKIMSFPAFVQLSDSIPPVAPTNLNYDVDSSGIVKIKWDPNPESDLEGYRIFRANFKSEEMIQISSEIIKDTIYVDSVSLRNLNERMYYAVKALDRRYNPSELSQKIEVKLPDLHPPVPPVVKNWEVKDARVYINWAPSSSRDVEGHLIYRKSSDQQGWELRQSFSIEDSPGYFKDETVVPGESYMYTFIAVDDDGLESKPTKPIRIKVLNNELMPPIMEIYTDVNPENGEVTISWNYNYPDVEKVEVFKMDIEGNYRLVKSVFDEFVYTDSDLKVSESTNYRLRAVFVNGEKSRMSSEKKVSL